MNLSKLWTAPEEDYVRANAFVMTDAEIGEHLGRTEYAVRDRRQTMLPGKKRERADEVVARWWGKRSAADIGCRCGLRADDVRRTAERLGLPATPFEAAGAQGMPIPAKPKGYTPEALAWAREHAKRDPEATLMLIHEADSRRRRRAA